MPFVTFDTTVHQYTDTSVPAYDDPAGAARLLRVAADIAAVSWMPGDCDERHNGGCLLQCLVMADDKPKWAWRNLTLRPADFGQPGARFSPACIEALRALYERLAAIRDADGSTATFRSPIEMLTVWNDGKPGLVAVLDLLLDSADDMDDLAHV